MTALRLLFLVLAICSFLLGGVSAAEDFYSLLGVAQDADTSAIKKAFRKKSLQYHPDKNPGDEEAAEKFKLINRAHEVLTDQTKRELYNTQGEEEVERYEQGGDQRQKGPTNKFNLEANLEELYIGTSNTFNIKRNVYCHTCKGSGAEGGEKKVCGTCKGQGVTLQLVNMGMMQMQMQQACQKCGGKGKINKKNCAHCKGKRLVQESKEFQVEIERGMADGDHIRFERQGEQIADMVQSDIMFIVKQKKHPVFKRVGNNLFTNMDISLEDALLGFSKTIQHLDGHSVVIKSEPSEVIQPFSWKIIQQEGMPIRNSGGEYGELHIKLIVVFPSSISESQRQLVETIFQNE